MLTILQELPEKVTWRHCRVKNNSFFTSMIKIRKNDYVTPTEVREHVVQLICDAFLQGDKDHRIFKGLGGSFTDSPCTECVNKTGFVRLSSTIARPYEVIRGCEMNAAFRELKDARYHVYRSIDPENGVDCFCVSRKPFKIGWIDVPYGFAYRMD